MSVGSAGSSAGQGGYRSMTLAGLGAFLAAVADLAGDSTDMAVGGPGVDRWRLVAEFLQEYRNESPEIRSNLLIAEPGPCGDERWDVFLAALAEHLAARDGHAAPGWAQSRVLVTFWFPFDTPAARVDAVVHAPASFRRRGIFVAPQELEVA